MSSTANAGTLAVDCDVRMSVAVLPPGGRALRHLLREGRVVYCHVAKGSVTLSGRALHPGDAALIAQERGIVLEKADGAEVLIFDLPGS